LIRAVAADIDGTLTDMQRVLNSASVDTMRQLHALGIVVVLVTGNTHCFTRAAAVMLGCSHFVAENGGVTSWDDHIEVLADRQACDQAYLMLHESLGVKKFDSRYRLTDLVLLRGFDVKAAGQLIRDSGLPVELVDTGFAVHIKNIGLSKGTGLEHLADALRIPLSEFAAVGDSESDLSMFELAGFSAAVANADPAVKEAADYVSAEPFGMGFAEVIRHLSQNGMMGPAKTWS